MEELLARLLTRLEGIGKQAQELYDTECQQRMRDAAMNGFVRAMEGYALADHFGMYAAEANLAVRAALGEYIAGATARASEIGLVDFHKRLAAFQNAGVKSLDEGNYYDDFFGYSAPEAFDSAGNVVSPST